MKNISNIRNSDLELMETDELQAFQRSLKDSVGTEDEDTARKINYAILDEWKRRNRYGRIGDY